MAGLQRLALNSLNIDINNSIIIGIIIAKSSPRIFKSKKKENETNGVWSFTVRDTEIDYINACVWGSAHFVTSFDDMFHVGDVVDILSARIKTRQLGERNEQFSPQVTSPFELVLNEGHSEMNIHEGDDFFEFLPLLHIPTKPSAGYITLAEIKNNAQSTRDDSVDLLVVVRCVMPPRTIKTKAGGEVQHREVTVMDQTTTDPLKILLWDIDMIKRSASWQSRETVLFLADVRLEWNAYSRCLVGRLGPRSVVTEDPQIPDAEALRVFALTAPIQPTAVMNHIQNMPDPGTIRTVMSVQQILDRASGEDHPQFTALLYAMITSLDLDGSSKILLFQCEGCSGMLKGPTAACQNVDCPMAIGSKAPLVNVTFEIRVSLTDHTGTISNVHLSGKYAKSVLECDVYDFIAMDLDARGQLKWRLLLERCTARLLVTQGRVLLLAAAPVDPAELVSKLPIY